MPPENKKLILRILSFALCIAVLIAAPVMISKQFAPKESQNKDMVMLNLWQIDSFEGGKGSRASYLKKVGEEFKSSDFYVNVKTVTADAARENLKNGVIPDMISYGAGMYGLESLIRGNPPYVCWANGGYCFLTLDNGDFSDISAQNTVINRGIDNFSQIAALFTGVGGAAEESPTGAYVSLINGKYKYLLGTQRDIFRLRTRGVSFKIKPVTEFNDLYQVISVTAESGERAALCRRFIDRLLSAEDLDSLGLFGKTKKYNDEMSCMDGIEAEYAVRGPLGLQMRESILSAAANSDINLLKNLLK